MTSRDSESSPLVHHLRSRIRLSILALSVVFGVVASGHCIWDVFGPPSWGPRLACAEPHYDWGEVSATGVIEHEFVLVNKGRQPLRILRVVPGCGSCISANASCDSIAPDDTSALKIVLDPSRLQKGAFRKAVLIETNDPVMPKFVLYVSGVAS